MYNVVSRECITNLFYNTLVHKNKRDKLRCTIVCMYVHVCEVYSSSNTYQHMQLYQSPCTCYDSLLCKGSEYHSVVEQQSISIKEEKTTIIIIGYNFSFHHNQLFMCI